jgi:hypothetical protein
MKKQNNKERGSLALEQVLFIGAIVAMSVGLFAFYDDMRVYFDGVNVNAVGNQIPAATPQGQ